MDKKAPRWALEYGFLRWACSDVQNEGVVRLSLRSCFAALEPGPFAAPRVGPRSALRVPDITCERVSPADRSNVPLTLLGHSRRDACSPLFALGLWAMDRGLPVAVFGPILLRLQALAGHTCLSDRHLLHPAEPSRRGASRGNKARCAAMSLLGFRLLRHAPRSTF